jgi:hypothetical protein
LETDLSGRKEDFEPGGKFHGRKKTPAEILQHRLQSSDSNPRKMLKSGSGAPLASAEKPVAVMAAEQSGMYSVDGKNLDNDPMANKAPMENVNQTDAATRSINITTDTSGRKTFHQKELLGVLLGKTMGDWKEQAYPGSGTQSDRKKAQERMRRHTEGQRTQQREQGKMRKRLEESNRQIKQSKKNYSAMSDKERASMAREAAEKPALGFQAELEPTICQSKEVFNTILEKTYYDDQVLERYKNSGKGDKNKSKRRHITNDITDTAGQQSNKTRGI